MPRVKHTLGSLSGPARAYVLGVILLGVAVTLYSVADLVRHPVGPEWLILVGADRRQRLGHAAHSGDADQLLDLRHLQHRRRVALRTVGRRDYGGARWPGAVGSHGEQPAARSTGSCSTWRRRRSRSGWRPRCSSRSGAIDPLDGPLAALRLLAAAHAVRRARLRPEQRHRRGRPSASSGDSRSWRSGASTCRASGSPISAGSSARC